jgi:hypothetical protein
MTTPKVSFFKLDSNVDGVYIDETLKANPIPNMIQVVAETDGVDAYPENTNTDFTPSELQTVNGLQVKVSTNINISGHGIIYDERGKAIAYKGELVFRDGLGNTSSLKNMMHKVNTIQENKSLTYLRDASLQTYNTADNGISLDDLIKAALRKRDISGTGNISLAARSSDQNVTTIEVVTSRLTPNNYVWIVGNAMVNSDTIIRLRDVTTNIVLAYGRINFNATNVLPTFCSYFGKLSNEIVEAVAEETCPNHIWNSMVKRFFYGKRVDTSEAALHKIALEVVSGGPILEGSINIVCIDEIHTDDVVINGGSVVDNSSSFDVSFETPMPSKNYSIALQIENTTQTWFTKKLETGFTINFDRDYNGKVFWTVIHNKNAVNISSVNGGSA